MASRWICTMFGHLIRPGRQSERAGASILVSRVLRNPTATGRPRGEMREGSRRSDAERRRIFPKFPVRSDYVRPDALSPPPPRTNNSRPLLYSPRDEGTINNWSLSVFVPTQLLLDSNISICYGCMIDDTDCKLRSNASLFVFEIDICIRFQAFKRILNRWKDLQMKTFSSTTVTLNLYRVRSSIVCFTTLLSKNCELKY
jgi:hypothetical protein